MKGNRGDVGAKGFSPATKAWAGAAAFKQSDVGSMPVPAKTILSTKTAIWLVILTLLLAVVAVSLRRHMREEEGTVAALRSLPQMCLPVSASHSDTQLQVGQCLGFALSATPTAWVSSFLGSYIEWGFSPLGQKDAYACIKVQDDGTPPRCFAPGEQVHLSGIRAGQGVRFHGSGSFYVRARPMSTN